MRRWAQALLIAALLTGLVSARCPAETWRLTVLHTNDVHGTMRPFDYDDWQGFFKSPQRNIGGMARRATLIAKLRRELKHSVVVADVGDVFADGPWSGRLYGVPEVEAMNQMAYDLFGVGNNEFQATFGPDAQDKMLLLVRRSRFPWLAANLTTDHGDPVEGIRPFVVRAFGDLRVAFLGLIPKRVATYAWVKGWKTEDPVAAAQRWVPIARREADLVVLVAHLGLDEGREILERVPGIDAMVGGDSHTFTPQIVFAKSPSGAQVPYVQAGEKGVVLGRLDLAFEHTSSWKLVDARETLILLDASIPEDPAVRALLDRYLGVPVARRQPAAAPGWAYSWGTMP